MGVCLSKCGATHKKAAVVAASISHRMSPTSTTDFRRSDHSLKTIFHIQDSIDIKEELLCTTTSSPRVSFEDCLGIPHSSELFSLPDEDVNRSSSVSPPQRRPSSTKSITTKSTLSIRDISEIPPNGDAQRPRGSFASISAGDPQELMNTLHQPGGKSVINSASSPAGLHHEKSMPKGAATHDAEETGNSDFIIRHSPLPRSHDDATGEFESSTRVCASSFVILKNCSEFEALVEEADSAAGRPSSFKEMMPFDNSVTIFLKEMENLVSMIQSPKRVIQGQAIKDQDQGKVLFHGFEHLAKSKEESPRLIPEAKLEGGGADDKVQYTKFEATFTDCSFGGANSSCFAETFQFCSQRTFEASEAHKGPGKPKKAKGHTGRSALADINTNIIHVKHAAPAQKKSSNMKSKFPKGLRRGMSRSLDSCEASITQVNFEPLKRGQGSLENLTHGVFHKTELPLMNTVTEDEICLDARGRLSRGETNGVVDVLEPSNEVTVDRMKEKNSMEVGVLNKSSELISDARGPSLPSGIAVPSIMVSAPTSKMLLQPQDNLDSESSHPTPPGILLSPFDLQNLQDWERQQPDQDVSSTVRCQDQELLAEPTTPVTKKPSSNWRVLCGEIDDPTPIRGIDAGLNEDSKKFLSKALESVLKLVHSPDVERTQFLGKLLEFLTAESEDQGTHTSSRHDQDQNDVN